MKSLLWIAGFLLCSRALQASPEALFSPDSLQNRLVHLIDESHVHIDAALFELTSPTLINALRRAAARGVEIRLLLNLPPRGNNNPQISLWPQTGEVRDISGRPGAFGLMHNKFAVFDGRLLVTGSYNWTEGAEHRNYENLLIEDDCGVVTQYSRQFDKLWMSSMQIRVYNSARFNYTPRIRRGRGWVHRRRIKGKL